MFVIRTLAAVAFRFFTPLPSCPLPFGMFVLRTFVPLLHLGGIVFSTDPDQQFQGSFGVGHGCLLVKIFSDAGAMHAEFAGQYRAGATSVELRLYQCDDGVPQRSFAAGFEGGAALGPWPSGVDAFACLLGKLTRNFFQRADYAQQASQPGVNVRAHAIVRITNNRPGQARARPPLVGLHASPQLPMFVIRTLVRLPV